MPAFSLLTPMPGLPLYLLPIWPLVFWRGSVWRNGCAPQAGRAVRCSGGWCGMAASSVFGLSDDLSGRRPCAFRAPVSGRLQRALDPETILRCPQRTLGPQAVLSGIVEGDPGLRREYGLGIAVPDTW